MRVQLRMFDPAGVRTDASARSARPPSATLPVSQRTYRLPLDLARWVRDEAEARGTSADAIVATAVALMQQNTVWEGGSGER